MSVTHCPAEVLDHIFAFTEECSPAQFLPQFPLRHLSLVCKYWNPIAERRLYRTVSIGSSFSSFADYYDRRTSWELGSSYEPRARTSTCTLDSFIWTLQYGRECLRETVCEIRLRSLFLTNASNDHFIRLFDALRACRNVVHFELHMSYINIASTELFSLKLVNLLSSWQLASIRIQFDGNKICLGASDLFRLAPYWPGLECIQFRDDTTQPAQKKGTLAIPSCRCPRLRKLELHTDSVYLDESDLRTIRDMTHQGVSQLDIQVANDGGAHKALSDCLTTWGKTLEHLRLITSVDFEIAPFTGLLPHLGALKYLYLDILRCDINELSNLSLLEEVNLGANPRKLRELAAILSDVHSFPSLKVVRVRIMERDIEDVWDMASSDASQDAVSLLRTACLTRGIDIKTSRHGN